MNRQMAEHAFRLGDRVCLSQLGKDRVRKPTAETGTVVGLVGNRNPNTVRVLFDGLKTAKSLHKTYIEPLHHEMVAVHQDGERR
jgi:hypothetical protein